MNDGLLNQNKGSTVYIGASKISQITNPILSTNILNQPENNISEINDIFNKIKAEA